jgi:hypothetical protein
MFCRSNQINIDNEATTSKRKSTRMTIESKDERKLCLFCTKEVDFSNVSKNRNFEGVRVKTIEFATSVYECCVKRADQWASLVMGRIEYKMSDLHAADCVYHRSCCTNFRSGRQVFCFQLRVIDKNIGIFSVAIHDNDRIKGSRIAICFNKVAISQ